MAFIKYEDNQLWNLLPYSLEHIVLTTSIEQWVKLLFTK